MRNEAWVQAMQAIRRSNAAVPIPSGKRYVRKPRSNKRAQADQS